ncbi:maleylpyruvate isomerase N-terminal domain-containing protein [Cellulomonas carbonis]|uniref:Mycothiol-dependent maleylpyruvate isomerase metal-binding domain-containing protein n=1 Tax=Cellulomonas carbonis T26 TaxID=947969 RepID=A0A0A0BPQ2_9CELL|nr:maleylpyruvate isomerase N-terminal domain-containing protein [Cellulomonas carbonis]KGM10463.1 hypothetical protein N868_15220 [Cellulomonas carbonis T26]GGC04827.1 hypothetical protein GCM10010972_17520 [Cellulomonas carbonis]
MTDLATTDRLLRAQWLRLREWLDELDLDSTQAPSVLPGWRVADLVAHLGRSLEALAVTQPAPAGVAPVPLGDYLATYAPRAESIDEATRALAAQISDDPLAALDRVAESAFTQLHDLRATGPDPVVQARVAPLLLSDLALTRLLELVVHGDDLDRSLPHAPGDVVLDEALAVVADALLRVLLGEGGWSLEVVEPRAWVRLACGRTPVDAATIGSALRPVHTSESLPELAGHLPVL